VKLLVAKTNRGKLGEIVPLLAGLPVDFRTLGDYPPITPPDETGSTFAENAVQKARFYAKHTAALTVAEDSGLEIDALDGAPGVHSARFGGDTTYPQKFALIEEQLGRVPEAARTARFVCALAVADGDRIVFEARGRSRDLLRPSHAEPVASATTRSSITPVWLHVGRGAIGSRPSATGGSVSSSARIWSGA
jgi:XTP/dITP diphosphohydrolase